MVYILFLVVVGISVGRLQSRIETGFYDAVMMRGATKWSYWLAQYINEVLSLMIPLPILMITQICFGINCPGIWLPWMQYAFTEPLFLYAWTYHCLV
jgi:hypothetical protein